MNKKYISFLTFFVILIIASSCFKDDPFEDKTFDGKLVEFERAVSADINNFDPDLYKADGSGVAELQVNLVGPQSPSDITVNYSVADSSTAVEGKHYDFLTNLVIPADSSFGSIQIDILDSSLSDDPIAAGESKYLVIVLEGNESIGASENYKKQVIYIEN